MMPEPSASIAPPDHQLPSSTGAAPRKRRHRWIWLVILLLFALLFYWIITSQHKSQQAIMGGRHGMEGPVPIIPATATTGSLGVYLPAIGTVTPVYTDSINAQVTGVITAVHYRQGQYVRKGDPLIDIDPRPYEATLEQAEGTLEHDQGVLAEAQMDLVRYQQAWAKNAIPRQTLDDQEKVVVQDQGTVRYDQGLVQYDKVQLGFCHIVSPIDGRVGLRLVDPGNLVTANSTTTLVVVAQMKPITVVFTLAEDNLPQVMAQMHRPGATLPVEAWNASNTKQIGTGKLTTIDNLIDTTTGTIKLRAEFPNSNGDLFPNQFVNTRLLVTTEQNQTIIPSSAIQHNGNIAFVYVVKAGPGTPQTASSQPGNAAQPGGSAKSSESANSRSSSSSSGAPASQQKAQYHVVMVNVKTGVSDRGMTAVQGIAPGTVVADSSFEKLVDGSDIYFSKQKLNIQQTSINGESNAP